MRIIGGIWANQDLKSPGRRVRPTQEEVRDGWLNAMSPYLSGARVLDLFAGAGGLGLEALSRGAACADFVDNSAEALHALKMNIAQRKIKALPRGRRPTERHKSARIFKRDAILFTERLDIDAYDIAFVDPPYHSRKLDRVIKRWHEVPFCTILGVEHRPNHSIPTGDHRLDFENSAVTIYHFSSALINP